MTHERQTIDAEGPADELAPAVDEGDAGDPGEAKVSDDLPIENPYLEDLQRLKAEFDNYRKRVVKEQTSLIEAASAQVVVRMLPILDNFELAVSAAEETRDFDRMLKGIEMVFGELKEVLRAEGLEAIPAKGMPFDPHQHEAAVEVPGDDSGHIVVTEILRPGYRFNGRVVRPAMVKVTQKVDASE